MLLARLLISAVQLSGVMKNWRPDRFQCPWILLQHLLFVYEVPTPTEFKNSPSTKLALNGMDVDGTSAL